MLLALIFIIFFMVYQIMRLVMYYHSLKNEYESLASKKIELQKRLKKENKLSPL